MGNDARLISDEFRAEAAKSSAGGHWEEALAAGGKAIAADPSNAGAWYDKCVALEHLGRLDEALTACESALQIDVEYPEPWREKANILNKLTRPEEALEAFDKALKVGTEDAFGGDGRSIVWSMFLGTKLTARNKGGKWDIRRRFR
jgi:tetratricopeptide (TPR) repeat protein